jgi:hypothetical protein
VPSTLNLAARVAGSLDLLNNLKQGVFGVVGSSTFEESLGMCLEAGVQNQTRGSWIPPCLDTSGKDTTPMDIVGHYFETHTV